jgi:uracil-DNA glycosylase family 4
MIDCERTKWKCCKKCGLHKTRKNVVLGRGDVNCDILFIGEAPGRNEDLLGKMFVGLSGRLLERLLHEAGSWANLTHTPTMYVTNACACRPCDSSMGDNRPPTGEELWACYPRLEWECKRVANPKKIILLGKTAEIACRKLFPDALSFQHPAYILRCGGLGSPPGIKFVRDLSAVLKEMYAHTKKKKKKKE